MIEFLSQAAGGTPFSSVEMVVLFADETKEMISMVLGFFTGILSLAVLLKDV